VELVRVIENSGGGETVDVGVIGEVVSEGMYGEDDAGATVREAGLLAQPVLQGVGDEVAELGEALGFFAEDVAEDSGDGENPVPVWDGQTNLVANVGSCIECAALVAARAAAAPLTSEGQEVVVVAARALDAEEAAGKVAAA
jgi:hypothetical protein